MKCVRIVLNNGSLVVGRVENEDERTIVVASRWVVPLTLLRKPVKIGDPYEFDDGIEGTVVDIIDGGIVVEVKQVIIKGTIKRVTVFKRCPPDW